MLYKTNASTRDQLMYVRTFMSKLSGIWFTLNSLVFRPFKAVSRLFNHFCQVFRCKGQKKNGIGTDYTSITYLFGFSLSNRCKYISFQECARKREWAGLLSSLFCIYLVQTKVLTEQVIQSIQTDKSHSTFYTNFKLSITQRAEHLWN